MTEKQIIKAVELAEGFKITERIDSISKFHTFSVCYKNNCYNITLLDIKKWEHYPILLRRTVEGFNHLNKKFIIDIGTNVIIYKINTFERQEIIITEDNKYLTKQEQAVEKALEELL